jgi:hypothetical protein
MKFKSGCWVINTENLDISTSSEKEKNKLMKGKCVLKVLAGNEMHFVASFGPRRIFENKYFRLATEREIKLYEIENMF